jgi:hypothetical protein
MNELLHSVQITAFAAMHFRNSIQRALLLECLQKGQLFQIPIVYGGVSKFRVGPIKKAGFAASFSCSITGCIGL